MTLVFSIFHHPSSPIFARVMIGFIYIYKEKKKKKNDKQVVALQKD